MGMINIRNIAIIAHVDHGKTTLVDEMLKLAGNFAAHTQVSERVMDSNPLERERGITILSKNTSVKWKDMKINIVDTPGHADFGGEVERILRMVDGVLLLVDAADGPMPQTRFVLKKALELNLQPIVVINKIDRSGARPHQVHDEVFDLFLELNATDSQLDFPTVFASAKNGIATSDPEIEATDMVHLFDVILEKVPAPKVQPDGPFQMLVSTIDYSPYLGQLAIGRIERGTVNSSNQVVQVTEGKDNIRGKVAKLFTFESLDRVEIESASAGEIIAIAGINEVTIGSTICDPTCPDALPTIAVDEPTMSVNFLVNTSPFAGREGKFLTSRHIRERLHRELQSNLALRVEDTDSPDAFKVSGRGELHLTILMETMRREGYEFMISAPKVILKEENGHVMEPYEEATIEVPEHYVGVVMEKMGSRRGELKDMVVTAEGTTRLVFSIPSRGLFGYRTEILTDTRGAGILNHNFSHYGVRVIENLKGRGRGVIISMNQGASTSYAIESIQERSELFIGPGVEVYAGMIVGENSRDNDLTVNITRLKKMTNMRSSNADIAVQLVPPRDLTLESALEFINDDEVVELTPESIRLRKMA